MSGTGTRSDPLSNARSFRTVRRVLRIAELACHTPKLLEQITIKHHQRTLLFYSMMLAFVCLLGNVKMFNDTVAVIFNTEPRNNLVTISLLR